MSSVSSPLKMKTFVQFSKCQPRNMKNKILSAISMKQSYWANSRCSHWHRVKPIMLAATAPESRAHKAQAFRAGEKAHLLSLADSARDKVSWRLNVKQAETACAKPKRKQGCTMVTTEGAAGPGGTRLCLSAHVINTCPYSKHFLKRCLSVSIYL